VGDRDQFVERIERPAVHIAGLGAHDHRPVDGGEGLAKRIGTHSALIVGRDPPDSIALPAEPEHLERGIHRDVGPFVGDDRNRRRTLQAQPLDVPAGRGEDAVTGGRQRGEVGHRGTGHEPHSGVRGESQQLDQPAGRDLLRNRCRRRHDIERCVLIPRRGQPVGRHRRRHGAADDESEIARTGRGHKARAGRRRDTLDHRKRIHGGLGERPAEARPQGRQVDRPGDGTVPERPEEPGRQVGGSSQELAIVGHRCRLTAGRSFAARRASAIVGVRC
jgi:hypothetical protein